MNKRVKKQKIDDGLINEIVSRIRSASTPRQIILFGSAASEAMTSDSDLDLLVIKDDLKNPREENLRLRKALSGIGLPVDVFAMTAERFSETKEVIGGLAYPANKYGKVIYEEP
ncbi:MAG: nucleotidyltransferase domain-containing protein [Deltaproteobacteria bacterium]|nr:nucleotidyltransferase domain-containing protein [Deltaproteobacteria bacterium]